MTEIAGKVALVTGGGSGIGRGIVLALADEGASVVVSDIVQERADEVAEIVNKNGGSAIGLTCDVSSRDEVRAMKAAANEAMGPVSLLFANAGVTWFDRFSDMKDDDIDWIIQVNLMGVLNCVHAFLPDMEKARDGHVVATASNAGLLAGWVPDHSVYSCAKLGVVGMMLGLQHELGQVGVGTTVYCPGGVRGRISESFALRPDQFGGPTDMTVKIDPEWAAKNVVGFFEPEDVGPMVMQAVKDNAPIVLDHSNQRPHWLEWYNTPVIAAFDAAEEWERTHSPPA
jgi:NAD(P)-dependent dehydrogenase (short-subunit alcohol dehydrogenase family)